MFPADTLIIPYISVTEKSMVFVRVVVVFPADVYIIARIYNTVKCAFYGVLKTAKTAFFQGLTYG